MDSQWCFCILMFTSIILGVKQEQYRRYSEAFNFFQSKSINMVIGNRKLDYVVHYRDLEFLDDETEYFKRYYGTSETSTRIKKLINYYEINMTPPAPNLLPIHNYHILETRNRKLLKLCIMREKSLARRSIVHDQDEEEDSEGNMILSQLNNSNYSAPSSAKEEESENDSFDSQPHNAYQADNRPNERNNSFSDDINLKEYADFLILQFKPPEELPKINIIPPPPPPPAPEKVTVSVAIQTLPMDPPPPPPAPKRPEKEERKESDARQKEKQREKQKERQRQKQKERQREKERERWQREEAEKARAQAKRQAASPPAASDGLGIRSEIKQNVILTESIEMVRSPKEEKKKTSTFMDYYNSIPVKKPTNILEKFLKHKK